MIRILAVIFLTIGGMGSSQAQQSLRYVKLVPVEAGQSEITRQFFGHVAARETVDLAFQVSGQIIEMPIVEGETVAKEEVIARLDLEPFELARDQASLQKDQADRTLERFQKLEGSAVSQVTVEDAVTQAKLAEISLRNAERALREARLLSPFDALVATRNVSNFTTISAGSPVVRLHDMSELHVEIDVPEVLFQQAGRSPDVDLWAKFPSSETRFPLSVREFNAETSLVGQTFQITLGMAPPEDISVFPGSSVTVYATLRGQTQTLRIPASAVTTTNDGKAQVMLFSPDDEGEGTVSAQEITIVPSARGTINVTSGLKEGQEIVASGANMLQPGERVRRFTGFSN